MLLVIKFEFFFDLILFRINIFNKSFCHHLTKFFQLSKNYGNWKIQIVATRKPKILKFYENTLGKLSVSIMI